MWKTILGWLGMGGEEPADPTSTSSPAASASAEDSTSDPGRATGSGPEPIGDAAPLDVDLELPPPMSELTTEIPHDADVEEDEEGDGAPETHDDEEAPEPDAVEAPDPDSLDGDDLITAFLDEVEASGSGFDPSDAGPVGASIERRDSAARAELAVRALEHTAIEKQWARARVAVTLANHLLEKPLVLDVDQLTRFVEVFPRARPPGRLLVGALQRGTPPPALVQQAMQTIEELGGTLAPTHREQLADLLEDSNESNESNESDEPGTGASFDLPDFGLDDAGVREVAIAGYTARLCAHPPRIEWLGKKGQVRKTLPKVVKRDAPDALEALEAELDDLQSTRTRQIDALQAMLSSDEMLSPAHMAARLAHPLTGPLVRRLVWATEDGAVVQLGPEGVSHDVQLWSPRGSDAQAVAEWRSTLFEGGVRQPFPQVWLDPDSPPETTTSTGDSRVQLVKRLLEATDLDASVQEPWVVVGERRIDLHTAQVEGDTPRIPKKARKAADAVFVPHDRDPTLEDLLALAFTLAS